MDLLSVWVQDVARLMDDFLVGIHNGPGPVQHLNKRQSKLNAKLMEACSKAMRRSVQEYLIRYYHAMRLCFEGVKKCVGLSVDASRVGGRATMLGLLTTKDNVAGWCPPQLSEP